MYSNRVIEQDVQDRKARERWQDLKTYWHLYLALGLTSVLTIFAGVYLGLAPTPDGNLVYRDVYDAARHWFFAVYFGLMFFAVSEGAVLYAKARLTDRDVDEQGYDKPGQRMSMSVMLVIAVVNVVITSVVAGEILACWLGALANWVKIPDFAQGWVVTAPPVLLVFYSIMSLVYQHNSHAATLKREVQLAMRLAQAQAQRAFADAYKQAYIAFAPGFAENAARASAQLDAQRWTGRGAQAQLTTGQPDPDAEPGDLEFDEDMPEAPEPGVSPEPPDAGDLYGGDNPAEGAPIAVPAPGQQLPLFRQTQQAR